MNSCNTDIFFSNYYHLQSVRFELNTECEEKAINAKQSLLHKSSYFTDVLSPAAIVAASTPNSLEDNPNMWRIGAWNFHKFTSFSAFCFSCTSFSSCLIFFNSSFSLLSFSFRSWMADTLALFSSSLLLPFKHITSHKGKKLKISNNR